MIDFGEVKEMSGVQNCDQVLEERRGGVIQMLGFVNILRGVK